MSIKVNSRYQVEYVCRANPQQPAWREDEAGWMSLDQAMARALEVRRARNMDAVRVLDEAGAIVATWRDSRPPA